MILPVTHRHTTPLLPEDAIGVLRGVLVVGLTAGVVVSLTADVR
jgi:hypothetical protein